MPELINYHQTDDADRGGLVIEALGKPGAGGGENSFFIHAPDWLDKSPNGFFVSLQFQDGPPADCGINGLTNEALLAVLVHRLEGFQAGKFACNENHHALKHISLALECLHARTRERRQKGIEGQLIP